MTKPSDSRMQTIIFDEFPLEDFGEPRIPHLIFTIDNRWFTRLRRWIKSLVRPIEIDSEDDAVIEKVEKATRKSICAGQLPENYYFGAAAQDGLAALEPGDELGGGKWVAADFYDKRLTCERLAAESAREACALRLEEIFAELAEDNTEISQQLLVDEIRALELP